MIELLLNKSYNCGVIMNELKTLGVRVCTVKPIARSARKVPSNYTGEWFGWILERARDYWIIRTGINPLISPDGIEIYSYQVYDLEILKDKLLQIKNATKIDTRYRTAYLQLQNKNNIANLLKLATHQKSIMLDGVEFHLNEIQKAYEKIIRYESYLDTR